MEGGGGDIGGGVVVDYSKRGGEGRDNQEVDERVDEADNASPIHKGMKTLPVRRNPVPTAANKMELHTNDADSGWFIHETRSQHCQVEGWYDMECSGYSANSAGITHEAGSQCVVYE